MGEGNAPPGASDQPLGESGAPSLPEPGQRQAATRAPVVHVFTVSGRGAINLALAATAAALALAALSQLRGVLVALIVGAILAEAMRPWLRWMERRRVPRSLALLLILLLVGTVLALLVVTVIPPAAVQIDQFIAALPALLERLRGLLEGAEVRADLLELVLEGARTAGGELLGRVPSLVSRVISVPVGVFSAVFGAVTVVLLAVFWLSATERLDHSVVARMAPDQRLRVRRLSRAVSQRLGGWARGQLLLMLAIGLVSFLVLLALGVDYPVPLAIWAGLTEIIPLLGPILGAVPAVLVALADDPVKALAVGLAYLLIQQVEGNFLVPKVMERVVGLHSYLVLASVLIGGALLGILGVLLAVPVAATVDALITELVLRPAGLVASPPARSPSVESGSPSTGRTGVRRAIQWIRRR